MTPMTKEALAEITDRVRKKAVRIRVFYDDRMDIDLVDAWALLDALEAKDKRIAELEAIEAHSNRGWKEAHEQEARAESAEQALLLERQKVAELESSSITVTLPEPDCAADFVLPVAVYTQETIIDCLASRRINIQIQGGE